MNEVEIARDSGLLVNISAWMKPGRLTAVIAWALLVSCAAGPPPETATQKKPARIVILHTNDMHAQFSPVRASWVEGDEKPLVGGFGALDAYVAKERAGALPTLLLDAGDFQTGTPLSNIEVGGALGGGVVEFMNLIGYQAGTLGNHEFDNSQQDVLKYIDIAGYPIVSANVFRGDSLFAPASYIILETGGLRIGVIGLMTEEFFKVVLRANTEGLEVKPVAETAQALIDEIDPITDLIVLLTHIGFEFDKKLASEISGADVIVGGHEHTRLWQPVVVNHILIVQAGSRARYLGRLEVEVQGDTVSDYSGRLIALWADSVDVRPEMEEMISYYTEEIDRVYGDTLAIVKTPLTGNSRTASNVGQWLAGVMMEKAGTDFAVINSGGIRKSIPAGPLTKRDVVEMLPFGNTLSTFEVTGVELLKLMERNAWLAGVSGRESLQLSGISYKYRVEGDSVVVSSQKVGEEPVDPEAVYTGVTVDFILFGQTDLYFGFQPEKSVNTYVQLDKAVMESAAALGVIDIALVPNFVKIDE